ncbi:LEAF RUST 10 DISEASE-RESISTANCE LOCUS RECEPTOR-LIKE PROTEIN KINASE-like 1.2 [Carex rostrata]
MCNRLIPVFLLLHLWNIALSQSESVGIQACTPVKCGSVNISYPFWVSKQQPDYCGYPSLEINCHDERPFLVQSYNSNYYIDRVFYDNSSFVLINSVLVNGATSCFIPHFNVSLGLGPMVISEINKELVFFFNCGQIEPLPVEYLPVPCVAQQSDGGNESFVRLLQNYSDDPSGRGELLSNCSISRIPVSGWNGSTVYQYTTLVSDGFLVELMVSNCSDCRKSGGQCGFNTTTSTFMCNCPDRNVYPMSCLDPKAKKDGVKRTIYIGKYLSLHHLLLKKRV